MNVDLSVRLDIEDPSKNYEFGILTHRPRNVLVNEGLEFAPDTIPLQEASSGDGKGLNITIFNSTWNHIRDINNDDGYKYARSIGAMWINNWYDQDSPNPSPLASAESISCGGNFIAIDKQTTTHYHIISMDYRNVTQNPQHNWYNYPWLYFKAIAINASGDLINVGQGYDCFIPLLRVVDKWINKIDSETGRDTVEVFPKLPLAVTTNDLGILNIVRYKLKGASVIGIADSGKQIYLLKATQPGERVMATSWRLETIGVIPPA